MLHHVRRDVLLLLLLLLAHGDVRQLPAWATVLRSKTGPATAHAAAAATTAAEGALCEAEELRLVRRAEVEGVRAQPAAHRTEVLRAGRAAQGLIPIEADPALMERVVDLLSGCCAVETTAGETDARAEILGGVVRGAPAKVSKPWREALRRGLERVLCGDR